LALLFAPRFVCVASFPAPVLRWKKALCHNSADSSATRASREAVAIKPGVDGVTEHEKGLDPAATPEAPSKSPRIRRDRAAPVNAEVLFPIGDIFFSRTNGKGHILFGNSVFQRISLYSWEELHLKPHSIIRHPDMPRAVFWLLWDTIEKGEPVGAYVKNMAKDGRYYWVFAIVTPVERGYLSVRIKPTGPFLPLIAQEYAALAEAEKADRLKPAESAQKLLARLSELGFRDYGAFMAAALSQEIGARDKQLGRPADTAAASFEALVRDAGKLLEHVGGVVADHAAHRYVPFNLRVLAAQLGEAGAAIGVIAMNYGILANSLEETMANFIEAARLLFAAVNKGLFLTGTAKIQKEASEQFQAETQENGSALLDEIGLLENQRRSYEAKAAEGLCSIVSEAQRFEETCGELKRAASVLETTRILGTVESARLRGAGSGLDGLLDDLKRYQGSMAQGLQEMLAMCRCIERDAGRLVHHGGLRFRDGMFLH
jgi:aerotaxis receptor